MQLSRPYALIKIFNPAEVLGFIAIIVIFLFMAFPKNLFQQLLLTKNKTNIDLTTSYLKALSRTKLDPEIKIIILKKYLSLGQLGEAEAILDELKLYGDTYNKYIKDALWIEYKIWKRNYFATNDAMLKHRYLHLMKSNLKEFIYLTKDEKELEQAYNESKSMDFQQLAKEISFRLAQITNSEKWQKIAFYNAVNIGDFRTARILASLIEDKLNDENTLNILYHFYYYNKNYKKSFIIAKRLMNYYKKDKTGTQYILYLLESAILSNNTSFVKLYSNELINMINNIDRKKSIIKKLINLSIGKKETEIAKDFILNYFYLFKDNIKDSIFIMKSAISLNDPDFAANIADKIVKQRGLISE